MAPAPKRPTMLGDRSSGVLLHFTSLPGPHGCGDLGADAVSFLDWLALAKQSWWQVLPIGPTGDDSSPFDGPSLFAGNPMLISLKGLAEQGWLDAATLEPEPPLSRETVDWPATAAYRDARLREAFAAYEQDASREARDDHESFCVEEDAWLGDWTLYTALKTAFDGKAWQEWGPELASRDPSTIGRARMTLGSEIRFQRFVQWQFFRQFGRLRAAAAERGVRLIGSFRFYPNVDSADVWANQSLFQLDPDGRPTAVTGTPPDRMRPVGEVWDKPVYHWERLRGGDYDWWLTRLRHGLAMFDALVLEHFIALDRVWTLPAGSTNAAEGRYVDGPGRDFLMAITDALGTVPLIAEDVGSATPAEQELRDQFSLPGTRVLQHSFAEGSHADRPHRFPKRCVVFTSMHATEPTAGWLASSEPDAQLAKRYAATQGQEPHWDMIRLAHLLPADVAIVLAQDLLGLGSEARMYAPDRPSDNWRWRLQDRIGEAIAKRLAELTTLYGRER